MRCKMNKYVLWFALLAGVVQAGCYKEDESDCVDSLEIAFRFMKNGADLFEPEVKSVSLFVFDENELFVGRWDEFDSSVLVDGYTMKIDIPAGQYNCVAWGGLHGSDFAVKNSSGQAAALVEGETTLDQLMMHIRSEQKTYLSKQSNVVDYKPCDLFYGSKMQVDLPKGLGKAVKVTIDLKRYSTQIRLIMKGLPLPTRANPYTHLLFHMEVPNGQYDFRDRFETPCSTYTYIAQFANAAVDGTLTMDIYTLKLGFGRGHNFTIYNTEDDVVYMTADLLEEYIREDSRYNTQEKVDAEDYFEIVMDIKTNLGIEVWVNGWKVEKSDNEIQ